MQGLAPVPMANSGASDEHEYLDEDIPCSDDEKEEENDEDKETEKNISNASDQAKTCGICDRVFLSGRALMVHRRQVHELELKKDNGGVSVQDALISSFCCVCNTHYDCLEEAQSCLSKHRRARCWICLKVFKASTLKNHIYREHMEVDEFENKIVHCRWCSFVMLVNSKVCGINLHAWKAHLGYVKISMDVRPNSSNSSHEVRKRSRLSKETGLLRFKKRKLDENGKFLQVAFRTGKPVGKIAVPNRIQKILKDYIPCDVKNFIGVDNEILQISLSSLPEVVVQMQRMKIGQIVHSQVLTDRESSENEGSNSLHELDTNISLGQTNTDTPTPIFVKLEVEAQDNSDFLD